MTTSFDDFFNELTAESESSTARAELDALPLHYSLARQLMTRRSELDLTQTELAERSGISRAEIGRIERGQASATIATLSALTSALDIDVQLVPR